MKSGPRSSSDGLALRNGELLTRAELQYRYLRNPATRARTVLRSVATSSAIEGIRAPFKRKAGGLYAVSGRVTKKKT